MFGIVVKTLEDAFHEKIMAMWQEMFGLGVGLEMLTSLVRNPPGRRYKKGFYTCTKECSGFVEFRENYNQWKQRQESGTLPCPKCRGKLEPASIPYCPPIVFIMNTIREIRSNPNWASQTKEEYL